MRAREVEITDLLWPVGANGEQMPVVADDVITLLRTRGQQRAARLVAQLPTTDGVIDPVELDRLILVIHRELQRLGEELQLDRRVANLLAEPIARLLDDNNAPVRLVDVGCGLGHVLRSASARHLFGDHVELVGVDLNSVLIGEARRLTQAERLNCTFVAGDAFSPGVAIDDPARTIVVSTGLLHHLSEPELTDFFSAQASLGVAGFAHWDIVPCVWSTIGAWIFHRARMREAISRHDGVLSARRAHPAATLLAAASAAAPAYRPAVIEVARWYPRALDVLRPIAGWRP